VKVGDLVRIKSFDKPGARNKFGIILDTYSGEYDSYNYCEVHYIHGIDWYKEYELDLINES
tara:strand:- start:413 stop:595 length:183 start_codon:yes stop_codon:yes gene_type:complete